MFYNKTFFSWFNCKYELLNRVAFSYR